MSIRLVADVAILAFSARPTVAPQGCQIESRSRTGALIKIRIPPGVGESILAPQIRPAPVHNPLRRRQQSRKTLLGRRIVPDIKMIKFERAFQVPQLYPGRVYPGLSKVTKYLGRNQTGQQRNDPKYDQQFD